MKSGPETGSGPLKKKEIRQQGDYRTQRLVLEAWDRMEANGEFTAIGM